MEYQYHMHGPSSHVPAAATMPSPPPPPTSSKVLSCAECRRSKLRCDRRFPCETCRKRGLQHLCPNDALVTRPNLAADAEYLRQENLRLKERVRQLEGALVALTGQSQTDPVLRHIQQQYSGTGHGYMAPPRGPF